MTDAKSYYYRQEEYSPALFADIGCHQAHAGHLSKMIHWTSVIIGCNVPVDSPREDSMSGGIW